jgi:hypothetical protein
MRRDRKSSWEAQENNDGKVNNTEKKKQVQQQ